MSEETIIDQTASAEKSQQSKNGTQTKVIEKNNSNTSQKKESSKENTRKLIGTVGIAGAAGVIAGLLTPLQVFPQSSEEIDENLDAEESPTPFNHHLTGHDMDVATCVDDSMSFNQAFAAARHELGSGGLFVWHGHTYSTYYAEEWNAMSAEDREQYWADVYHTTSHLNEDLQADNEAEIDDVDIIPDDLEEAEKTEDTDEIAEIDDISDDAIVLDDNPDEMLEDLADENSEELFADEDLNESDETLDFEVEETELNDTEENPDLDLLASNSFDSDIPIDNNMDMSDFA